LDGAAHAGILAAERDSRRERFLQNFGVEILRFENEQVFKNREGVLETIRAVLKKRA
jgi:very-short-patch-repair endonuclease